MRTTTPTSARDKITLLRRLTLWTLAVLLLEAEVAFAQSFPVRPVRIVTSGIGGANDFTARLVAYGLTAAWSQQVIVENRGGASAAISALAVLKAPPDGYTLLSHGSPLWMLPFLQDKAPYDPVRDFAPVALVVSSSNILVVHPSLPVKSVRELISLALARPGDLNYGTTTLGSPSHLSAELFKSMAGLKIVSVPYKGAGQAVQDLMSGRLQLAFPSAAASLAHVRSGRLKALAVTSSKPSALFAGLPTIAASGLPGYESVLLAGVLAPAGTPADLIARINRDIVKAISTQDMKERFLVGGSEIVGGSPEDFASTIKSEMTRMGKVIRDAGIRAE